MIDWPIRISLKGQVPSGKNQQRLDPRSGRKFPNRRFKDWRSSAVIQILQQKVPRLRLDVPMLAEVRYTPGDLIARDVPGIEDALWHLMEHIGIVKDDKWIEDVNFRRFDLDRKNPGVEIFLWGKV